MAFDGPLMLPQPPPPGVWQPTASAWCGHPRHPRVVLRERTERELKHAERRWRCPVCGEAACWQDR